LTYQLAAALTLLEAGIYTLDHIMDREVDGPLAELPRGALLLGSVCLISHLPNQVLAALPRNSTLTARLAGLLADGLARIGAGQLEDFAASLLRVASSKTIQFAVTMKSGERRALFTTMAAMLAGGTPAQVEADADFGRAPGIARQLWSDLVDLFGAVPSRGLANGALTLPIILYLEQEDARCRTEMERLLANAGKQADVQRQVQDRLRDSGIMREIIGRIERQCSLAIDTLGRARPLQHAAVLLRELALSASVLAAR
jgi:geranylgeranyl pyrophosphate synthase